MLPIFTDKEQAEKIFSNDLDSFSKSELDELKKAGIITDNDKFDTLLLESVCETRKELLENKITIMYLIPTNTCNLMCKYCFIGKLNEKPCYMEYDTAIDAVDKFYEHLCSIGEKGTIFFYGAEPLLNFDLIKKVVLYSKEKGYDIEYVMVSNGILLNAEIANFIKENSISLGLSIDGPKNINDSNRIFKGSKKSVYDVVLSKIKLLKSMDVDFNLSITVAPVFLDNEEYFLRWIEDLGIYNISYNLLHFTYKTDEWKSYYKKAVKFIYKSNNLLFNKGFNEDRVNRKYDAFYNRTFKFSDCAAIGGNQLTICPNGDIEICHGYWNRKERKLPNIKDIDSFSDLFSLDEYKKWATNITLNKTKCLNCPAIYICGGGCAMQSKDLFGDERKIDKAFCIYTKFMLRNILKEVYIENNNISEVTKIEV